MKDIDVITIEGAKQGQVLTRNSEKEQNWQTDQLAEEVAIAFSYNGQNHAVMMASPMQLHDFAIGFSFTEKIIDSIDDILNIDIQATAQGICVNLQIKPPLIKRLASRQRKMSGRSGCGICGITDLAAAFPKLNALSKVDIPEHEIINQAIVQMRENQTLQEQCGAVHCAAVFDVNGKMLSIREDVGRHNALDKLIGANLETIKKDNFILMSSRASYELVTKTIIAGVGTLVCISAATTLAIEISKQYNLNLIGFIRGARQLVYTGEKSQ